MDCDDDADEMFGVVVECPRCYGTCVDPDDRNPCGIAIQCFLCDGEGEISLGDL